LNAEFVLKLTITQRRNPCRFHAVTLFVLSVSDKSTSMQSLNVPSTRLVTMSWLRTFQSIMRSSLLFP